MPARRCRRAQLQLAAQNQDIQGQLAINGQNGAYNLQLAQLQSQTDIIEKTADIAAQLEEAKMSSDLNMAQLSAQTIVQQQSINAETQREQDFYSAGVQQSQIQATTEVNLANIMNTTAVQQATINAGRDISLAQISAGVQNTQTKSSSKSSTLGTIASIATAALAIFSDARMKTDIELVKRRRDGIGIYRFRFAADGPGAPLYEGVLAHEVARLYPHAVLVDPATRLLMVDYDAIGATFKSVRAAA